MSAERGYGTQLRPTSRRQNPPSTPSCRRLPQQSKSCPRHHVQAGNGHSECCYRGRGSGAAIICIGGNIRRWVGEVSLHPLGGEVAVFYQPAWLVLRTHGGFVVFAVTTPACRRDKPKSSSSIPFLKQYRYLVCDASFMFMLGLVEPVGAVGAPSRPCSARQGSAGMLPVATPKLTAASK